MGRRQRYQNTRKEQVMEIEKLFKKVEKFFSKERELQEKEQKKKEKLKAALEEKILSLKQKIQESDNDSKKQEHKDQITLMNGFLEELK